MIKIYSYNDKTQLSTHFNVKEFKCWCGKNHEIKIDTDLIKMLERLFLKLGASKCIISSGYRCTAHDKAVGGNGNGQHTKGTAADVCYYDRNNKPISSKLVSCIAQDLGFKGIANINSKYKYIHLDMRANGKYYGDETKGYNSVTKDFYSYYDINKEADIAINLKEWQNSAIKDGFSLLSGADGIWGAECLSVAKKAICKRNTASYTNKNLTRIIQKAIGVTADGLFGKATEEAVKAYQKKHGLTADGIVGLNTWKKMLNIA